MVGHIWTSNSGTPRVTGGGGSRNKDLITEGPSAFGSVGLTGTLSYEHKQLLITGQNSAGHTASDADAGWIAAERSN